MAVKKVTATINGVLTTLMLNSQTGKYEATVTAPSESSFKQTNGYYNVTVQVTDEAGNVTTKDSTDEKLGESLKLVVKEKVAPTIVIVSPTSKAVFTNNTPKILWKITDADSGVNSDSISLTIDGTNKITNGIIKTEIVDGYQCEYIPDNALTDGTHTIKFDVSDNDSNAGTSSIQFKIDTIPPTLSVTNPVDGLITNNPELIASGTTNDATSSPCVVTINDIEVDVATNGTFSKTITLQEGVNTLVIISRDKADKSTTITRTVTLDTIAPTITNVILTPNPVDGGKTFIISVECND